MKECKSFKLHTLNEEIKVLPLSERVLQSSSSFLPSSEHFPRASIYFLLLLSEDKFLAKQPPWRASLTHGM